MNCIDPSSSKGGAVSMAKKNKKQKESAKSPPKIKYEDTEKFKAFDRMMRSNRGVRIG